MGAQFVGVDLAPGHRLVGGGHLDFACLRLTVHHLALHGGVFGGHDLFAHRGRGLEHLAADGVVTGRHLHQAHHIVVELLVVGLDHPLLDVKAFGPAAGVDLEGAQRAHLNGLPDPGLTTLPFAAGVGHFDAFADGLVHRRHRHQTLAGLAHHHPLGDGAQLGLLHLQPAAGFGAHQLFAHGAQRQRDGFVAHRLGLLQHPLGFGAVGGWHGGDAGGGGLHHHFFVLLAVFGRNGHQFFALGADQHTLGHGFVGGGHHFKPLGFGAHHHPLAHHFVGGGHRLFAEAGGLDHDLLLNGFVGGGHRNLALEFGTDQHLFGHGLEGGRDHFHPLCGGHFDDLFGFGFKLGRDQHVGKTFAASGHALRTHGARQGFGEVVVALLHGGAHQAALAVEIGVDRHGRAIRHPFADQRGADPIAPTGAAHANVTGAFGVSARVVAEFGGQLGGLGQLTQAQGAHRRFASATQWRMRGEGLVKPGGAGGHGRVALGGAVVAHIALAVGDHAGVGLRGQQQGGADGKRPARATARMRV